MEQNYHDSDKDRDRPPAPTDVDIDTLPVETLSDRLYRLAKLIAEARSITYEPISGGEIYGEQSSTDAHLTGAVGEIGVQKFIGKIKQPIFLHGDPGYDLISDGSRLDVKSTATHMRIPDLLVPADQELVADVFFLAHRIEPQKIRLIGWAPRHVVAEREPKAFPGNSLNYVVPPEELYRP